MKTMKLEIDGKMKDVQIFEYMWEYINHYGSDITHYELSPFPSEDKRIIGEFAPVDDVDFGVKDTYEIDGQSFIHVNWGENEVSLIPEDDLNATFWTTYDWVRKNDFSCTGKIFQTRDEALAEIEAV